MVKILNLNNNHTYFIQMQIFSISGMDLSEYLLKTDHFEKMHVLKDEGKVEGAPNWRQVDYYL